MDVLVWGSNKYGQLSAKKELHLYTPVVENEFEGKSICQVSTGEIDCLTRSLHMYVIIDMTVGDYHSLLLTDYGEVYSRGRGWFS